MNDGPKVMQKDRKMWYDKEKFGFPGGPEGLSPGVFV
jgi:hypothetical protein